MSLTMTVALLAAYLMNAMLTFTPLSEHAYYEKRVVTETRYSQVAQTIAEGVLRQTMVDDEKVKLGLVMVSVGDAESHWNAAVVSCAKGGDNDKAWGPWQTQLPKEKVCVSTASAFDSAMAMVKTSFLACKRLEVGDRLSWYTDGACKPNWKRSQYRMNRALAWAKSHPFNHEAL